MGEPEVFDLIEGPFHLFSSGYDIPVARQYPLHIEGSHASDTLFYLVAVAARQIGSGHELV